MSQKKFFEQALQNFIMTGINDQELQYKSMNLTRENLLAEINKIGNSLAYDYMSELELRLNGTFSPQQNTKYTLNDNAQQPHTNTSSLEMTPQQQPPQQINTVNRVLSRPSSPGYATNMNGMHTNNNTLSQSVGPGPHHTPMASYGSTTGGLTPQTSAAGTDHTPSHSNQQLQQQSNSKTKSKKVKTGGAFNKAVSLLKKKK
eukprot:202929_1